MSTTPNPAPKGGQLLSRAHLRGRIQVLPSAVAAIAGHAAIGCYGVMGTSGRGLPGVADLLHRDSSHRGVDVRQLPEGLAIDVFVIVQYGTRITEVARNLQQAVRFDVERSLGVAVVEVNVFVQGVHEDVNGR